MEIHASKSNVIAFTQFIVIVLILIFSGFSSALEFNKIKDVSLPLNQRINSVTYDKQGFIWLASKASLWRYDGYSIKPFHHLFKNKIKSIKKLYFDKNNTLWIGTEKNGLFKYDLGSNSIQNIESRLLKNKSITAIDISGKSNIWLGTNNGLMYSISTNLINQPLSFNEVTSSKGKYITSILDLSNGKLLVGTKQGLFYFNKISNQLTKINLFEDLIILTIYQDFDKNIWVGTSKGVYKKIVNNDNFIAYKANIFDHPIPSVYVDEQKIWIGSFYNGLYSISKLSNKINHYKYHSSDPHSLSNNSVVSLTGDNKRSILWVNTFSNSINYINKDSLKFGVEDNSQDSVYCLKSQALGNLLNDGDGNSWITSHDGLIQYNSKEKICENHYLDSKNKNTFRTKLLNSAIITKKNIIWLATTKGLNKFNKELSFIDTTYEKYIDENVTFIHEQNNHNLLIGTHNGLFEFNPLSKQVNKISFTSQFINNVIMYSYSINQKKEIFFATSIGIATIKENKLIVHNKIQNQLPTREIYSVYFSHLDELWVGADSFGVFHFNVGSNLIGKYNQENNFIQTLSVFSFLEDNQNYIWAGTSNGLLKINPKLKKMHMFHTSDGLQGEVFSLNAATKFPDGKLYFGGRNGFNAFYPKDIMLNMTPPNIVLTDFTRFGKSVEVGVKEKDFLLKKDINKLQELTLTHKDYVIGFEFAALDFADPSRNKYAYMMEGLDPEWIYTNADNRRISYSNLKPGEYTFRVKGSNKDGIWNETGKSLKIVVKPAPWFSWWAYIIYGISFFILLSWYINRKNKANKRITKMLRIEVAKQTQELKAQKTKVESLLAKKNELFANVSHEFRTPLTLILGPINKLLKTNLPISSINDLKMVNRNANRLLTMIEQLLQLAKVSNNEEILYFPLETKPRIYEIVKSFTPLAQQKRIELSLNNNVESAISTTTDALDIILGNLLSNAIKYTQTGGKVTICSIVIDNKISISVKDTGSGLDQQQQKDIFNRFKRLDLHQNIQGIGIGLSVVESLLSVNNASMQIVSKPGEGSTFTVSFNTIEMDFEEPQKSSESLLLRQLTIETTDTNRVNTDTQSNLRMLKESILIIEDNDDMRAHIADTLKDTYHCLLANRGKAGVALAIKHVPDIIICDVMMPEMDGFQVSRVMRSDTRTSHIPLVLLTALHDKESRIKGWREHVDVYLTKPFDAQELLIQLENILVIRNILKRKAGQQIKIGQTSNSDLPKRDQVFVNKLNQLIVKKYKNPLYLRPQLASDMAVSERQLQRKLKALIDKNPMDLLREYRLSQAAIMLKDGYQVGITSDECGFNSVAYFSQCFKAQYGVSPKAYQTACK